MANTYPTQRGLAEKYVNGGQLLDISNASISYAPCPAQGIITDCLCTISAAITGSDTTVTLKKISGGTTSTLGTMTAAVSGSAAGTTFTSNMSGTEILRSVKFGDTLVADSDGVSSTTSIANFLWVLKEL